MFSSHGYFALGNLCIPLTQGSGSVGHGSGWRAFRRLRAAHPSATWPFVVDVGRNVRRIEKFFFQTISSLLQEHTPFVTCHCRYILQNLNATTGAKKFLMAKTFDWNSWVFDHSLV